MSSPDPGTLLYVASGLGAVLLIVVPWAWLSMDKRVEKAQVTADSKASNEEMNRQRDNVSELFKVFREHERADRDRHDALVKMMNDYHVELLDRIKEVGGS
jgi:hypothetical protein